MGKTPKQLDVEIDASLATARQKRVQRDLLERPTPPRVLRRIDLALESAEDQIGRHLATTEVAQTSPQAYRIGNELYDDLEKLRWKIRKWRP
jgi:hypothetical protein